MKSLFALSLALFLSQGHALVFETDFTGVTTIANLSIGPTLKRYTVRVRNCADSLKSIKITVKGSGVSIQGAGIAYTDGTGDTYNFSTTFDAGYESSWIDTGVLKSANHCISAVYVNAQSTSNKAAHVAVFGNSN